MPRLVAVAVLFLALAGPAAAQPNVILIVTDDQRWDTLEAMPTVQSELVAKGQTFTNSYVVNPLCCPARASILTGTYSNTNGVWANNGVYGGFQAFDDSSTLPVWLKQVGYETMYAGRYLNRYESLAPFAYVPPGWDRWFSFRGDNPWLYFDYTITDGIEERSYGAEPGDYATDVLAAEAASFIREKRSQPFFLLFSPRAPHWGPTRWTVDRAPRHVDQLQGLPPWRPPSFNEFDVSDKPAYIRALPFVNPALIDQFRQHQLESLLAVDEAVADMLAALEETGKLADTLIVFTSDNGHAWGEHRWPQKTVPYEESLRVPLVVRYDRLGAPPGVRGRFALNIDLAPTIAEAAGVELGGLQDRHMLGAARVEGLNLLPLIAGQAVPWRTSFLIEQYDRPRVVPSYCGFRNGRWKYVQYGTREEEIYDLRADPYELQNVRAQRPIMAMEYREQVLASKCRPPRAFRPLRPCTITGTRRADRIRGTRRRDWICAGRGNDWIDVRRGGRDVVRCDEGFDVVYLDPGDIAYDCERMIRT